MQYIIDGHNLIPHISGLSLSDPEDEQKLIDRLNTFCRLNRAHVIVFFDHAALGRSHTQNLGFVTARFVARPGIADTAIAAHLKALAGRARNFTVVSSDRMVQAAAREAHAHWLASEEFANLLEDALANASNQTREEELSDEEVKGWEDFFDQYGRPSDGMIP